ncbi:Rne/Rng family ribonuclease [uncultured Cohaesibacter sp.]|uniref:Rne/Rng family ribonuclease n=1 Tax=uncultured Cohaesibacter sp. TaxID=1002546 RepID=UPI002AAADE6D|nr:Rne/Rng family ribonuclease [uncultured Cohaesibacter sp.]
MANQMLVDATHPEETRVVVVRGNRVEEFDFESANRKQLRGNIYLAKVTRVEPSLQAAFVDYGGNRHGFLAFSEIHPDYYQIPMADRQALLEEEKGHEEDEVQEEEKPAKKSRRRRSSRKSDKQSAKTNKSDTSEQEDNEVHADAPATSSEDQASGESVAVSATEAEQSAEASESSANTASASETDDASSQTPEAEQTASEPQEEEASEPSSDDESDDTNTPPAQAHAVAEDESVSADPDDLDDEDDDTLSASDDDEDEDDDEEEADVEHVGAEDALEEVPERRSRRRVKQYKIQEVIKRRQILLVQVVKEERGNKGAALTTYLSLAGRYSVLMPNTARGGGISRKITNVSDRKRLKQIASELEVADGMGVILRTAGASRTKTEIKRDFEYLLRLWENVRDLTLKSAAPMLVYEEGSLIKRSIRDLYNKDIDQVLVAGEEGYKEAKSFMRMLMPSHARNVQPYREPQPIFTRLGIESQLDAMFSPQVTLKSGGYIVIDQTEALVSIDVNSGRSTREHNIEDTALSTNLEAAEEISRQLRLRDLAGLVVIDFIDMEEKRNNRAVEKRLKDCLKSDRARIQVGRISHFGLMEMSRQRIRTGVLESTMDPCPHCQGTGYVRAAASVALLVLRSIEDHLLKGVNHHVVVRTRSNVALYILNEKRANLFELENRFGVYIHVEVDDHMEGKHLEIDRGEPLEQPVAPTPTISMQAMEVVVDEEDEAFEAYEQAEEEKEREEESSSKKRRRRRRRKKAQSEGRFSRDDNEQSDEENGDESNDDSEQSAEARDGDNNGEDKPKKSRRRGRRGGRRNRRNRNSDAEAQEMTAEAMEVVGESPAVYNLSSDDSNENGSAPSNEDASQQASSEQPSAAAPAADAPEAADVAAVSPEQSDDDTAQAETAVSQEASSNAEPEAQQEEAGEASADGEAASEVEPAPVFVAPTEAAPVDAAPVEDAPEENASEAPANGKDMSQTPPSNAAPAEEIVTDTTNEEKSEDDAAANADQPSEDISTRPIAAASEETEVAKTEPEETKEEEEDDRPKRTGWWNRSGFL